MVRSLLASCLLLASFAVAQGTEGPGSGAAPAAVDEDTATAKDAKALVQKYLTLVKAKKWADAKKLLHPKTLEAIAERKKRLGKEDHPMAPWHHEKVDAWLKDFKVTSAREAALGTVVVEASEDNFQVADKGVAPGEQAAYLVGQKGGKWFVVDKKRGETFSKDSVRLGYRGWFDAPPPKEETPQE